MKRDTKYIREDLERRMEDGIVRKQL